MMSIENPWLYHFTHRDNLPGIVKDGLTADGKSPDPAVECADVEKLGDLDIDVRLYRPGTPAAEDMLTRTERPTLTVPRSRLLAALSRYIRTAWRSGVAESPRASLLG